MSYCINPNCSHRHNDDALPHCQTCGTSLLIQGQYRLLQPLRPLSEDYPTEVFEVDNQGQLKVLKSLIKHRTKLAELFEQEFNLLTQLSHPGIPKAAADDIFTVTLDNGQQLRCLVMEKIAGQTLEDWSTENGALSQSMALDWLKQLLEILDYLHRHQFFHRDIKPSNILLQPNGKLALIDFGTVRSVTPTITDGRTATTIYSYGYTAPEQLQGKATPQSDLFALGRTFIHLTTGQHPQHLPTHPKTGQLLWRNHATHLSKPLADVLDRMTALNPQHRPQRTTPILRHLEGVLHHQPHHPFCQPMIALGLLCIGVGVGMAIANIGHSRSSVFAKGCDPLTMDIGQTFGVMFPGRPLACFSKEAEALSTASDHQINLLPTQTLNSVRIEQLQRTKMNVVLCQSQSCGGGWWAFAHYPCDSKINVPSFFDERTSSLIVGTCGITLYQSRNHGGRRKYFPIGRWPSVGSELNDKTSSIKLGQP